MVAAAPATYRKEAVLSLFRFGPLRRSDMKVAVWALAVAGGVLLAQAGHAQENPLVKYCKPDIERLCPQVPPGDGRLLKCLKSHGDQISVGCAKALQKLKG